MIHTAKFYVILDSDDIDFIENKYSEELSLLGYSLSTQSIITCFSYFKNKMYMHLNIDFIKLLNKSEFSESDLSESLMLIKQFLYKVFNDCSKFDDLVLTRIDYRVDVKVYKKDREILLYLYKKARDKYGFKVKCDDFDSTIYFKNKSIQVCIYDKEEERKSKGNKIEEYEKSILRLEVRLLNRHLNYSKKKNGIIKCLENYFNESTFKDYISKNINPLIYKGNYYKIDEVRKILEKSNLSNKDYDLVLEVMKSISNLGVTKAQEKYSYYLFKKTLTLLESLNINPIMIPKNLKDAPSSLKNPFNSSF